MSSSLAFVILIGIISLFADMTYEGARSITGQYLAILGASGAVVGVVAGLGEFIGYGFRLVSGYISDKTEKYWLITMVGYAINLLAIPCIALAGNWPAAATLIILERFGKAIRTPPKDAMLSYAAKGIGRGWGFGLHEALDQVGGVLGPLLVSVSLYWSGSYQMSFGMLLIPALCALGVLIVARVIFPHPQDLEVSNPELKTTVFSKNFWLYIAAVSCVAAGYVDFPLIAYHFKQISLIPDVWIPIFFSVAMAADGVSALICGRMYDKKGISVLIGVTAIASLFAPLVFIDGFYFALTGIILWGIGLGAQESIVRAVVADLVSTNRRATAYGLLNICFGLFWFLGSTSMGFLYDLHLGLLIAFSLVMQLISIPIFISIRCQRL